MGLLLKIFQRRDGVFQQEYEKYTDEDAEVWSVLFDRQIESLQGKVPQTYFDGLDALGVSADKIPSFQTVNERLSANTGWTVQAINDRMSGERFFGLLRDRQFPSTTFIRTKEELGHCKEPDMFHDFFGHVPLLHDPTYESYVRGLAELAGAAPNVDGRLMRLGRLFKWTIEFGLYQAPEDDLQVYGAGLISSNTELFYCLGPETTKIPYTAEGALTTEHKRASLQPHYFVIESFDHLKDSLHDVAKWLDG